MFHVSYVQMYDKFIRTCDSRIHVSYVSYVVCIELWFLVIMQSWFFTIRRWSANWHFAVYDQNLFI